MALMLRQLAGSSLSEEDLGDIVSRAFQEAGVQHTQNKPARAGW